MQKSVYTYLVIIVAAFILSLIGGGKTFFPLLIFGFIFAPFIDRVIKSIMQKGQGRKYYEAKTVSENGAGEAPKYDFKKSFNFNEIKNIFSFTSMMKKIWLAIGGIIVLIILLNSLIVIPAGHTGVYHLFGKVRDQELRSGIHLINPLANVEKMNMQTQEYTMSIAQGEGRRYAADAITALTKEGLNVDLDITVLFHLNEESASDVFKNIGKEYEEKLIRPTVRSVIREVTADYLASDVYSEKRTELAQKILTRTKENLEARGIITEDVLLRNVNLPQKIVDSIAEKLAAEQEAQRYDFVLEKEEKEADRKRIEAKGQRDAQTIIAEGLTDKYLEYLYIQSLKDRQGTIYVPTSPESGLPLFKGVQ